MTCIEISELNGRAGNQDYFLKSRQAEAHVLKCVSRLIRRPITETAGHGRHACDFSTSQGILGDVKISSGDVVKVELSQVQRDRRVKGWFEEYQTLPNFGGLLMINHWHSRYHGQGVFKIRWIPWHSIQAAVPHARVITNRGGSWCELDPTRLEHYWLGDFMQVPSAYGDHHKAFDASRIHSNNQLDIQQLYKWF